MSPVEIFHHRVVGPLECNCYVVGDPVTRLAMVIDPGEDAVGIAAAAAEVRVTIVAIVATHAHFDHITGGAELKELTGAPFYLHQADRPLLAWMQESGWLFIGEELPPPPEVDQVVVEGDRVSAGAADLEVLHTPGHSPGSISLVGPGVVFSGDTLFAGSVGRTDLPGGDGEALVAAVRQKLFSFDDDTPVHPGHGPPTTIGAERRYNPFVGTESGLWTPPG